LAMIEGFKGAREMLRNYKDLKVWEKLELQGGDIRGRSCGACLEALGIRCYPQKSWPVQIRNAELKIRATSTIQSLSVAAVDQIVERCYTFPFKKRTQVGIATNVEIASILFLDCPYVGISTLLTEFTVLITAAIAAHSRCVFCHYKSQFSYYWGLKREPLHWLF
jgi:hypothetical protein